MSCQNNTSYITPPSPVAFNASFDDYDFEDNWNKFDTLISEKQNMSKDVKKLLPTKIPNYPDEEVTTNSFDLTTNSSVPKMKINTKLNNNISTKINPEIYKLNYVDYVDYNNLINKLSDKFNKFYKYINTKFLLRILLSIILIYFIFIIVYSILNMLFNINNVVVIKVIPDSNNVKSMNDVMNDMIKTKNFSS